MAQHLASIRSKLSDEEVAFVKAAFGLDLRNPLLDEQSVATIEAKQLFEEIEGLMAKVKDNERVRLLRHPICSFCSGSPEAVGPLAQSNRGVAICSKCAQECVVRIREEGTPSGA
jgi:hypothetical protein